MRALRNGVSTYDPATLVRAAAITKNYRLDFSGVLDEDERLVCVTCGFTSRLPGTPASAWRRLRRDVEPPVVELCEICNAAAVVAVRQEFLDDARASWGTRQTRPDA